MHEPLTGERERAAFARDVVRWQRAHGRQDLPWQKNPTPYRVWVSEIMLQQTQTATAAPYFRRFMARYPGVRELAAANLDDVLSLWSGLGYYARARNMHAAARILMRDHRGSLPRTQGELVRLPGIGRSTAGAILSLAFGEPYPVLDANIARVLARVFAVRTALRSAAARRDLWNAADSLQPKKDAAAYAQGMMDLGALVCLPKAPRCGACPVRAHCGAHANDMQSQIPVQLRTAKKRQISATLAIILLNHQILLVRRPHDTFWGGLWTPPIFSSGRECRRFVRDFKPARKPQRGAPEPFNVEFTHLRLALKPLLAEADLRLRPPDSKWQSLGQLDGLGLPAKVRELLEFLRGQRGKEHTCR